MIIRKYIFQYNTWKFIYSLEFPVSNTILQYECVKLLNGYFFFIWNAVKDLIKHGMLAYFCNHLSDNYVGLSYLYVKMSDHCQKIITTSRLIPFFNSVWMPLTAIYLSVWYMTIRHNFLTSQHNFLTSWHNLFTNTRLFTHNYVDLPDNFVVICMALIG